MKLIGRWFSSAVQSRPAGATLPTHLADQLLLLGRVGHVLMDVSEELLQRLLRVLLGRGLALLVGGEGGTSRPLQEVRGSALSRGGASR